MYGLYGYGTSMYGMGCGHYSYGGMYNGLYGGYYGASAARYYW